MKNRISLIFATGLGLGYLPGPTGTYGSGLGLLVWLAVARWHSITLETINAVAFIILSIPASTIAAKVIGRKDPGHVVCDEIAGQLIALFLLPLNWKVALMAFLLFRAFDIVKPFPADKLEQLPNGWGIVADDVMAGIYSNLIMRVLLYLNWLPLTSN